MEQLFFRDDPMSGLADAATLQEKLAVVHKVLQRYCAGIDRISVALYDSQADVLKTFLASPIAESPLSNYQAVLNDLTSLHEVAIRRQPRVVHDLQIFDHSSSAHTHAIVGHGFASSYTHPMYQNSELIGFIFFDSFRKRYFRERVLEQVDIFVHLVGEMIMSDFAASRALVASLRTLLSMVKVHNVESGNHMERMARYARLIGRSLVKLGVHSLDDEQLEQIFLFAPLHDVGKLAIPDRIVKKTSKLDLDEREVMNTHTTLGRRIIDELIVNFKFEQLPYIDYLRNIAEHHHETMDGRGYPHGLKGPDISLEARITAVSDIFDALTSKRSYKETWSNEQAFAMLQMMSIDKLDKDCVGALVSQSAEIMKIQRGFADVGLQ